MHDSQEPYYSQMGSEPHSEVMQLPDPGFEHFQEELSSQQLSEQDYSNMANAPEKVENYLQMDEIMEREQRAKTMQVIAD